MATTPGNAINQTTTGIVGFTGTAFTGTPVTNHAIILGGATSSALGSVGPSSTSGQIVQSAGASADPVFSTATYPATAGTSGKILISDGTNIISSTPTFPNSATSTGTILRADGTNWVATTSTYPNTNAVSTLLYASSANVMAALATANNAILATDASGVPSITTASGNWLNTSRCAFSARMNASTTDNKTGDGTAFTVVCDTEQFDQGSNYNNSTGTFTAPIAGRYYLNACIGFRNIGSANRYIAEFSCSTAGTIRGNDLAISGGSQQDIVVSVLVSLAASETVNLIATALGTTKTVGIQGGGATNFITYMSAYLVC